MKKRSLYLITFVVAALFSSCGRNCGCGPIPQSVYGDLPGRWEWIKTTTPSKTIWAKDAGYSRRMDFVNDKIIHANKISFYKNDSLERDFLISKVLEENWEEKSILLKYNSDAQLKIFRHNELINEHYDIEMSEIMPEYSIEADTVRHFYHFVRYLD
ncbi:hypothetical protein [Dyadobacter sp. CY356]|uniref:hypothetical protein n=1 Tax=Dyadobacter sp. CY356 TaxID=2906442 RepID=UPI001F355E3E|nr:hypothetical protein [Dyadobacter sp. CY356]MCF0057196.1 hypothetical protein [Dyadobacter sp. CY356]